MLFEFVVGGNKEGNEMILVQLVKCVQPPDVLNDALACLGLRRAAADGGEQKSNVDRVDGENSHTAAGKRFGENLFESNLRTAHVVRVIVAVHQLTTELPWNLHRLYVK